MTDFNNTKRLGLLQSPALKERVARSIWRLAWLVLARFTPVPMHRWRAFLLRQFGAKIAPGTFPYPDIKIWSPRNLVMERGSCLGPGVDCYNVAPVVLREGATVSQKTYLCAASHDFDSLVFPLTGGQIEIGRDAWVAADAFVGPGLVIGPRAVVLARSVVVRDVEPGTVVGGNPSRRIRLRKEVNDVESKERLR